MLRNTVCWDILGVDMLSSMLGASILDMRDRPNLPTNIIPTKIAWLKLSGKSPMDIRIPPLKIKITVVPVLVPVLVLVLVQC